MLSPADDAFERFCEFVRENALFHSGSEDLSESDTRAKLIDPVFKSVLGWQEADIRREEPSGEGYADYVLGADYPHLHIEAKRIRPRFTIICPSRSRVLKLKGPHLLGDKSVKPAVEQAARYAPELGTEFTIVTNGSQYIAFRTRLAGKSWRDGVALVWHDLDDIKADFATFHGLLSRESVRAGSLLQRFSDFEGVTATLYSPLEFIHNADVELVRNRFWTHLSRIVGPLLTDQPDDVQLQEEIIRYCYVRTPLSDQADANIDSLIKDVPSEFLRNARTVNIEPHLSKRTAFDHAIEADVKASRAGTYILTGGVGSGKTTFLRRFERVVQAGFVREYCVWVHVDFLSFGNVDLQALEDELRRFTFRRIREILQTEYAEYCPKTGAEIRSLFSARIAEARLTALHNVPEGSATWEDRVNALVHNLYSDTAAFSGAVLAAAARRGRRVVFVLDNTDQLGERFQESVFLLSQRLAKECSALTIVSLREEKFFAAYRRGLFDAYGDRRFHIGSPSLEDVIRRRLAYSIERYRTAESKGLFDEPESTRREIETLLSTFINSTTRGNRNIVRLLSSVSNADMRYALAMFREFISSGNTDVDKILAISARHGNYTVPFHEFAKSAILGSRRYYRSSVSHVLNVFVRSAARGASHLAACRLLARLSAAQGASSGHGEGFVATPQLLGEYRQSFGFADDLLQRGEELLRRGLIESEPPRASSLETTDAVRLSASGAYYWQYLVRSFAYIDLVLADTPVGDRELAEKLATMANFIDLSVRFERVRLFIAHLEREEHVELTASLRHDGPYREALMKGISEQIEKEIRYIRRRTGAEDLSLSYPSRSKH